MEHLFAAVNVCKTALQVSGAEVIRWFHSSDKVQRRFCGVCGSTLFWQPQMEGYKWTAVPLGLFDTPTGTRIAKHTLVGDNGD